MAINIVWIALILIGLATMLIKGLFLGEVAIFDQVAKGIFESADLAFEICLGLAGIMAFWMGIMNVGKEAGLINRFSKAISPFLRVLFPGVPKGDKSLASMSMNMSANMLGLDNAATPLGLEAMKDLQELNPKKEEATDAQVMFLALNTAGVTIIPTSIIAIRQTTAANQGIENFNGADIFLPTLIVTFLSFIVAMFTVAAFQKINLFRLPVLLFILLFGGAIFGLFTYVQTLPPERISLAVTAVGSFILLLIIGSFMVYATLRKQNVYSSFIEGAKQGFDVVIMIVPYLVAMLFAISIFRNAGCLDYVLQAIKFVFSALGTDTRFVDALPVGLMKPFSGGGARGILVDILDHNGVNSFAGKLASIMQGGTETTLYVLAVYFGSVGIKNSRQALICGLIADVASVIIAIFVAYAFYG